MGSNLWFQLQYIKHDDHRRGTHSKHRITYFYRDAIWTNADQSGIGLSSVKVSDQCEQEDYNSPCVWPKVI
jgi:hypothetical protein